MKNRLIFESERLFRITQNFTSMNLDGKKVLTFDCYGTLIDWETGIINALRPILNKNEIVIPDEEILRLFGNIEHEVENDFPSLVYSEVLGKVLISISSQLDFTVNEDECQRFGASIKNWLPFPDTVAALQKLSKHFKLVIVSNIDNVSIEDTKKHLQTDFYRTYTAQEIGAYKPSIKVFQYVFAKLEVESLYKEEIIHVAESLYHDHIPAKTLKLDSVWINRRKGKMGSGATPQVDPIWIPEYTFPTLMAFADWVEDSTENGS